MQVALVDANVLIAAASRRDAHNEAALSIVRGADHEELPTLSVTNHVLAQTLNYVAERAQREIAVDLYDRLDSSTGFRFERVTSGDEQAAIDRYRASDSLSFVDAALGAYAARTGVEYCYSFDDDLDELSGLSRLDRPIDPYAPD